MTIDWFSFFFGAMSVIVVEFVVLVGVAVSAYRKQQKSK